LRLEEILDHFVEFRAAFQSDSLEFRRNARKAFRIGFHLNR